MSLKISKMKDVDSFVAYIKECLELDGSYCISVLDKCSSNLLLLIEKDNTKYIVKRYNSECFFKIESFVLQKISGLKIMTPRIIYCENQESSKWNWLVYNYIEGRSLYCLKEELDMTSLSIVFYEVGQFLKTFHQLSIIDGVSLFGKSKQKLINQIERNYSLIIKDRESECLEWTITFLRSTYTLLDHKKNYTLVIKDFSDKHLLIKKTGEKYSLSGVIDFESVQFSHKYSDFVLLYIDYFLRNRVFEKAFLDGYELVKDKDSRKLIAFFILQYALELCGLLKYIQEDNEKQGMRLMWDVKSWLYNKSNNNCIESL